jgi:N-acetylmuramoyl-L-alanine amidase
LLTAPAVLANVRVPPVRPTPVVRLAGADYVDALNFGARFGLKATGPVGLRLSLRGAFHRLDLEADSREAWLNGVRVFLGDPVRVHKGGLYLSRLDADKLLTPILQPGVGVILPAEVKTIMLDPGHGGHDPGMQNARLGLTEKTLTLDTVQRLKKLLEAQGFKVRLTRDSDRNLARGKANDLRARVDAAAEAAADLFISVHYNSVESGADRVTGIEVYTLTPQFQFSHSDPGRADSTVGIANLGNRYDHWNALLGYTLHRELVTKLKASDRGLKRGRLAVLRLAPCPAVLVEAGFLSNDEEAKKIATPAYRQQVAEAIADAVRQYANTIAGVRKTHAP